MGVHQAQLVLLAVGLRDPAGAVFPAAVQRRVRVVVLPGEDADRVRVLRSTGRLSVARDLTGERSTRVPPVRTAAKSRPTNNDFLLIGFLPPFCATTAVERRAEL